MSDKRSTRDEALKAYEEAYGSFIGKSLDYDRLRALDAVAALFGGYAEPIVEMPEVEPTLIHVRGTDLTLQQEAVLCARSNVWPEIIAALDDTIGRPYPEVPIRDVLQRMRSTEFGVGPDLKS